jgi:hypothetical protein
MMPKINYMDGYINNLGKYERSWLLKGGRVITYSLLRRPTPVRSSAPAHHYLTYLARLSITPQPPNTYHSVMGDVAYLKSLLGTHPDFPKKV